MVYHFKNVLLVRGSYLISSKKVKGCNTEIDSK